ncbi:sialidase family protein [Streptomyces fulvoviolaceus]|uniref:sialidase family protein n=1 Tax=Streptomyces fulvoviolaceus TaxID=285535 RepID=UPI0009965602|nr:sialidase family protein [Streptomyces fulvoviolaceus]MCT9082035.1 glycoside hydrolase [Streptomyces fulvoviolaceus]
MALVMEQRSSRRPRVAVPAGLLGLVAALLVTLLIAPDRASAASISAPMTAYQNTATEGDGPRTPDIISTSENDAVVVWREGTTASVITAPDKSVFDHGYIRYSYTTDGGTSWSRPQTLAQETSEYSWHYVELYKTGNSIIAYMGRTSPSEYSGLPINAIVAKESTDGGHTWHDFTVNLPLADHGNLALAGRPVQMATGRYVMPVWWTGRQVGALYSDNLQTWTAGTAAANPTAYLPGEPQLVISQDDPTKLLMVARSTPADGTSPTFALTAVSTNGGESWGALSTDTNVPNNDSKGYFTKDSTGRYLTIYNTKTNPIRQAMNYRTKSPGAAWSSSKLFADPTGPTDPTPAGTGAGWDTYPMGDEYAPGKYFIVWEHDTSAILVSKLDISDT